MTPAAVILGSLTVPGRPDQVSRAREFAGSLAGAADSGAVALLTSELVTNAVLHTRSGQDGGTVTVAVIEIPDGLVVEVTDDGSPGHGPEVSGDRYASSGHGLFLVEQFASQWGHGPDGAGTTVWFQLAAAGARCDGWPSGRTARNRPAR